MTTMTAIIISVLGSNGLFTLIQYLLNRNSTVKMTMEAVSYTMLSDKLELRLDAGYATPEQRKEMEILIEAYKKNGSSGSTIYRPRNWSENSPRQEGRFTSFFITAKDPGELIPGVRFFIAILSGPEPARGTR